MQAVLRTIATAVFVAIALRAQADDSVRPAPVAVDWKLPLWADTLEGFEASLRLGNTSAAEVSLRYAYSTGDAGTAPTKALEHGQFTFRVPPPARPAMGTLTLVASFSADEKIVESAPTSLPLAYVEELDITGNPPVELLYPLGDDTLLAKYIPCCNIFGGTMMVSRYPVNPVDSAEGLPGATFSDYAHFAPDDLVVTTAGLHMHFTFDLAKAREAGAEKIAPFLWDEDQHRWNVLDSYQTDVTAGTMDFHYPAGGLFVLAAANLGE
ncbi:MAG: hypothetical protein AAB353_13265 [Candidatus Hydrogenedentota bacterium]